ncbi:hypothetical protein WG70_07780 [Burkholderia oklahomensis EO147]|nr:hypothetical protein WG70_07780 [Burkholderia oklahomensis EO147]AOI49216.1 hypothetical protein WI23_25850 [Burkholderia oklahomensis C6786]KUY51469.1 hypothetical protein WG70_16125 [Burkholderia oklahomensis EO147]KUY60736.1 hypothetical protein WI23_13655 [Burkholderia oklahomensis C6786]
MSQRGAPRCDHACNSRTIESRIARRHRARPQRRSALFPCDSNDETAVERTSASVAQRRDSAPASAIDNGRENACRPPPDRLRLALRHAHPSVGDVSGARRPA